MQPFQPLAPARWIGGEGLELQEGVHQLVPQLQIAAVVQIEHHREGALGGAVGLSHHLVIEAGWIEAEQFIEVAAFTHREAVGEEHGPEKETAEQAPPQTATQLRPAADQHVEDVAMAVLVLAPGFEEIEQGCNAVIGMGLEMAIDQDVAPVADLLGEIHRIQHPAEWKPGDRSLAAQGGQIDRDPLRHQRPVEEAGVARFIAGHQLEQAAQIGATGLDQSAREFLEQQEAGKLRHTGAHQVAFIGLLV